MRLLETSLVVAALWLALPMSATAQRQAGFSRWADPAPNGPSQQPRGVVLPDSVRQKVGYRHWTGAAIGAGVGAVLGSALAFGLGGQCADCTTTTWDRAQGALVITGASGVLGFLVGLATPKYVWTPSATAPDGE